MKNILTFTALLFSINLVSQDIVPSPSTAEERMNAYETRMDLIQGSIMEHIPVDNIGPTVFSGRVSDIEVNPIDPSKFYVAYASGGLFYTGNNGTTFEPVFDNQAVLTIGDIAVDWDRNVIWLGSGEVNSSRSSYAGNGMYRSDDGGKTWSHHGLDETHHIGRVLVHPDDPNTVWVAALGHLYSPNEERGIFKTTDGGKTWNKVLYVDENSGGIDMVFDPQDFNTIYAAMWQRERRAWNFVESGSGSGIYKSTDGGNSWTKLNTPSSGFPHNEGVGRIGLAAGVKNGSTIIYSVLDNYNRRSKEEDKAKDELTKDMLKSMSNEDFLALKEKKITDFLKANRFPRKYNTKKVINMVKSGKIQPNALAEYLEDANSLLFDTPVIAAEVYRSDDGGATWKRTHKDYLDGVFNSYGYYFAQIRVAPDDVDKVYIMGVPILKSEDGGATWKNINGDNVHSDHHALWVNNNRPGHLINGNDGGINISYDDGENWIKCNSVPVGQFYHITVDNENPYNVYGGLQDNGVWVGPSTYRNNSRWHSTGHYPYESILGGDGMQVQVDNRDVNTVYSGFQFGNYFRINRDNGRRTRITPGHELGERPYRWNWQSPILLSSHNQDIVYFGANKLFRSMDKGDNFKAISEDLTSGGRKGDVAYGTITTIDESTFQFGLIYVGTDDGHIHITKDGGNSWAQITDGLPSDMWVSRVIASTHNPSRVYAVLNGYRWDDFTPYLYVSDDHGMTWKSLAKGLPHEALNVVKEDPDNEDIIYVGSDHGVYISTDRGMSYMALGNMPHVAVHDIVIHPRDGEMVIGTHGRSLFKTDIKPLRALINAGMEKTELMVFETGKMRSNANWGRVFASYRDPFEPKLKFMAYSKGGGKASMIVKSSDDLILKEMEVEMKTGISELIYDMSIDESSVEDYTAMLNEKSKEELTLKKADTGKHYLQKGEYIIVLKQGDNESSTKLVVE